MMASNLSEENRRGKYEESFLSASCVVNPMAAFWQLFLYARNKSSKMSGAEGGRTPNLRRARAAFSQLNYGPGEQL
jgi:hypothetical protein